jgi:hypothetical protein
MNHFEWAQLFITIGGFLFVAGSIRGVIKARMDAFDKRLGDVETLYVRTNKIESQQAAVEERCKDRGATLDRILDTLDKHHSTLLMALGVAVMALGLMGCTYDRITEAKAGAVSVSGTRISVLQRTSASFDRGTSGSLRIGYNNDSQAAAELMQQTMAMAVQAAGIAAKAPVK